MTAAALASAHHQFEAALPAIRQSARYVLRRRRRDRDDLLAEAIACAWKAWRGLVARGRNPVLVGVTAIARWAACHALKGRRIGNRGGGRGAMDVFHRRAQGLRSFRVVSFDHGADAIPGSGPASWRECLVADRRVTPADEACFRLDFEAWLVEPARASPQDRRVARRGPWDPRGRPVRGDHAAGRQPGPLLAGAELARNSRASRRRRAVMDPLADPGDRADTRPPQCELDRGMARGQRNGPTLRRTPRPGVAPLHGVRLARRCPGGRAAPRAAGVAPPSHCPTGPP